MSHRSRTIYKSRGEEQAYDTLMVPVQNPPSPQDNGLFCILSCALLHAMSCNLHGAGDYVNSGVRIGTDVLY